MRAHCTIWDIGAICMENVGLGFVFVGRIHINTRTNGHTLVGLVDEFQKWVTLESNESFWV